MTITASEMARKRQVVTKTCPQCGTAFKGLTIKDYCSRRCKQAAYYERKKAKK